MIIRRKHLKRYIEVLSVIRQSLLLPRFSWKWSKNMWPFGVDLILKSVTLTWFQPHLFGASLQRRFPNVKQHFTLRYDSGLRYGDQAFGTPLLDYRWVQFNSFLKIESTKKKTIIVAYGSKYMITLTFFYHFTCHCFIR